MGSLSPWHRVDLLLQALSQLKGNQYRLRVVGYGAEYTRLRTLANELGVENNVSWLGAMPHDHAVGEIAQFDIAVLPGTIPTGAPMKLFEYAALARPAIAPDLPNLRAWFANDEIYFVKPEDPRAIGNAITSLRTASKAAQGIGLKAQARVREYTWEKIVRRILDAALSTESSSSTA